MTVSGGSSGVIRPISMAPPRPRATAIVSHGLDAPGASAPPTTNQGGTPATSTPAGPANANANAASSPPLLDGSNGGGTHGSSLVLPPPQSGGGPPTLTLGTINNVVGGNMKVTVTAPTGATLASVSWQIPNAEQAQPYSNQSGSTTPLPNPVSSPDGGQSSSLQFYWDNTTGNHTIDVSVTYAGGGGGGSTSMTVAVVAPTVNSFLLDTYGLAWANPVPVPKATWPGFVLSGPAGKGYPAGSGLSPAASVTLPATATSSGNYGFIQMVSLNYVVTNPATGNHTLKTNGFVLDNNPQYGGPTGQGWLSFNSWTSSNLLPGKTVSNTQFTPRPPAPGAPIDTPILGAPTANANGVDDPANEANLNFQVSDWLVYKSGGGIWVGIGQTQTLVITGDEKLGGSPPAWAPVSALVPGGGGVFTPGKGVGPTFVTWTGYSSDNNFIPPYPGGAYFSIY